MKSSKCVFCGTRSLAGFNICPKCLKAGGAPVEAEENLQDIAAIINFATDTDKNLKTGMKDILHIAGRLKRMEE